MGGGAESGPSPLCEPTYLVLLAHDRPDHSLAMTDVLGLLFYRTAFEGGVDAIGLASALAVGMFAFIFGVSLLASAALRRHQERLT